MMKMKHWSAIIPGVALMFAAPAGAIDLRQAVQAALTTNPEIRQAVANRVATEEERVQGEGLYYPRISVEGSAGARRLRNPTRRTIGIADETLWPIEGDFIVNQLVFDSGGREAEIRRQAARTDGAAARVEERSEYIALNVARTYVDYLLQQRLVAIAQDNAGFHQTLARDLGEGVSNGSISIADQQQAEERLQAARARLTEAQEELENAAITFRTLTGLIMDSPSMPPNLSSFLPPTIQEAEAIARYSNPRVEEAVADLAAAREVVTATKAELGPKVSLEGRARYGHDIDGFSGRTTDLQGLAVVRWDLFNGGINRARVREEQARADEAHARLFERTRQAEEDARTAWSRLTNQTRLLQDLERQSKVSDDLILSYREQFNIGRRSLLDVLDAQNTRFNVQAQAETARLASLYAQYRLLASANKLVDALGVVIPTAAYSNARARYRVQPGPAADLLEDSLPMPAMGPPVTGVVATAPVDVAPPEPAPE